METLRRKTLQQMGKIARDYGAMLSGDYVFGIGRLIVVCWVDFEDLWKCNMATEPIMSLYQV